MKTLYAMLLATVVSISPAAAATHDISIGCIDIASANKFLSENEFVVLVRSTGSDNKFHEIWINGKSLIVTVAYEKPKNNDSKSIKEACIVDMTRNAIYNGDTVEILNKSLEKSTPKT